MRRYIEQKGMVICQDSEIGIGVYACGDYWSLEYCGEYSNGEVIILAAGDSKNSADKAEIIDFYNNCIYNNDFLKSYIALQKCC